VPGAVERFLGDARLIIGDDRDDPVDPFTRRAVDTADLTAGRFSLEIASDDTAFADSFELARDSCTDAYGEDAVELVVVVTSAYLKLADVTTRMPLAEVERMVQVGRDGRAAAFRAINHGCDVEAFLLLRKSIDEQPLSPWRKATWLSRVRFELRTGLEGVGFNILPLTDAERALHRLPDQALRYVALEESPLEANSTTVVNLYVDSDLLSRLRREPRKSWAKAFTDQLAVDVLTAIATRALADPAIHESEWSSVEDSLLGALIVMVGGKPPDDEAEARSQRQTLLEQLRDNPHRFGALIEATVDMRDSARFIVGGG